MRNFNVLAALAATLLVGGVATAAKEKPAQPREKKICKTEEMSGRITPRRICRTRAQWNGTAERTTRPAPQEPTSNETADTSERRN